MGVRERQAAVRAMRGQMWSPGRPSKAGREDRVRFWEAIAHGMSSEDAAGEAGVSQAVGSRWFRQAGGMPPISLGPVSGRYLSFAEREEIAILHAQRVGVRAIARHLGRAPSTISRELRRNASTRTYRLEYRASTAQWHAERRASRPKVAKLAMNDQLREYVQERLAGAITRPDGGLVAGPEVRWIGRRHGRRQDRRWARSWSPEQIANRSRSISRMMSPCGSRTRRSIRRSTCKAGVRCAASWSRACGPGEHCECHELELVIGARSSLPLKS